MDENLILKNEILFFLKLIKLKEKKNIWIKNKLFYQKDINYLKIIDYHNKIKKINSENEILNKNFLYFKVISDKQKLELKKLKNIKLKIYSENLSNRQKSNTTPRNFLKHLNFLDYHNIFLYKSKLNKQRIKITKILYDCKQLLNRVKINNKNNILFNNDHKLNKSENNIIKKKSTIKKKLNFKNIIGCLSNYFNKKLLKIKWKYLDRYNIKINNRNNININNNLNVYNNTVKNINLNININYNETKNNNIKKAVDIENKIVKNNNLDNINKSNLNNGNIDKIINNEAIIKKELNKEKYFFKNKKNIINKKFDSPNIYKNKNVNFDNHNISKFINNPTKKVKFDSPNISKKKNIIVKNVKFDSPNISKKKNIIVKNVKFDSPNISKKNLILSIPEDNINIDSMRHMDLKNRFEIKVNKDPISIINESNFDSIDNSKNKSIINIPNNNVNLDSMKHMNIKNRFENYINNNIKTDNFTKNLADTLNLDTIKHNEFFKKIKNNLFSKILNKNNTKNSKLKLNLDKIISDSSLSFSEEEVKNLDNKNNIRKFFDLKNKTSLNKLKSNNNISNFKERKFIRKNKRKINLSHVDIKPKNNITTTDIIRKRKNSRNTTFLHIKNIKNKKEKEIVNPLNLNKFDDLSVEHIDGSDIKDNFQNFLKFHKDFHNIKEIKEENLNLNSSNNTNHWNIFGANKFKRKRLKTIKDIENEDDYNIKIFRKIKTIIVCYKENEGIFGFRFIYKCKDLIKKGIIHGEINYDYEIDTLELEDEDVIEITTNITEYLIYIQVKTKNDNIHYLGDKNNNSIDSNFNVFFLRHNEYISNILTDLDNNDKIISLNFIVKSNNI